MQYVIFGKRIFDVNYGILMNISRVNIHTQIRSMACLQGELPLGCLPIFEVTLLY